MFRRCRQRFIMPSHIITRAMPGIHLCHFPSAGAGVVGGMAEDITAVGTVAGTNKALSVVVARTVGNDALD